VVPNMVQGTALATAALQALREIPLPLANNWFGLRTAYRQAQAEGTTALGLRDARAALEVGALVDEVLALLGLASAAAAEPLPPETTTTGKPHRATGSATKASKTTKAARKTTKTAPKTAKTGKTAKKAGARRRAA